MQEIRSSKPPVVTGICDPNKSGARHHRRYLVLETDEANCETMKKRRHRLKTQLLNDSRKNSLTLVVLVDTDLDFLLMELDGLSIEPARYWRMILVNLE